MSLNTQIQELKQTFNEEFAKAQDLAALEQLKIRYLGRRAGVLTALLRSLKDAPEGERRELGAAANQLREAIEEQLTAALRRHTDQSTPATVDVTLPGTPVQLGSLHLVTQAIREIQQIFERIGFYRVRYPEVEWDWYAFEALNMPPDHPARDEWETFFIDTQPVGPKGQRILTPHSTSGTARELAQRPPLRSINISKCYRRQLNASHVPMFHQFDGLLIDKHVTIAHLKGTLEFFIQEFFGRDRTFRIRPFHFQFTEPSLEFDVSCGVCKGKGQLPDGQVCKLCKDGWLELGGGGMVHPNVLRAGGLDPKEFNGFAFGWGVERCYLMKAGLQIPDIRILYQNDLRFLRQF